SLAQLTLGILFSVSPPHLHFNEGETIIDRTMEITKFPRDAVRFLPTPDVAWQIDTIRADFRTTWYVTISLFLAFHKDVESSSLSCCHSRRSSSITSMAIVR